MDMVLKLSVGFVLLSIALANVKENRQVWRVIPSTQQELRAIKNLGNMIDFWKHPTVVGAKVDLLVEEDQRTEVSAALPNYEVLIEDVEEIIASQFKHAARVTSPKTIREFDYSVYHKATEIYAWMYMVTDEFSDFVTRKQIGVTYKGNPMYVLEFTKPSSSPKPKIFVDSLIHCREWITTASLLYIFKEMLVNEAYSHMLEDADWYFVPIINVDGYIRTWEEDRLWRKTVRPGASSRCEGVDANRNFDSSWSKPGASPNPCSAIYYGPTAASESEVRNLAAYVQGFGRGNVSAYVTVHSYSQLILYPYGFTEENVPEYDYLDETSRKIRDAIKAVHGKDYIYGPSSTTIYVTSGTTQDWAYDEAGVTLTYTFELRDEGKYGFVLPPDQIVPQGEEFLAGLEALKNVVMENF